MENPYHWPEALTTRGWSACVVPNLIVIQIPSAKQLTDSIRSLYHIPEQSGILLGNGSDEIIQMLLMALPSRIYVLTPEPGFVMYKQVSLSLG